MKQVEDGGLRKEALTGAVWAAIFLVRRPLKRFYRWQVMGAGFAGFAGVFPGSLYRHLLT